MNCICCNGIAKRRGFYRNKNFNVQRFECLTCGTSFSENQPLDNLRVDYYGTPTPLNQVANLHVPEPNLITIQPWDVSQIGPIEKSIRVSDLGLNPSNDGKVIRLPIPPLTEERRKEMVKRLHGVAEHHRVSVRNIRRDGNEGIKALLKDKKITEDEEKRALDESQKVTNAYMEKIAQAAKAKEKEILEIK